MPVVKCACTSTDCPVEVKFDFASSAMFVVCKDGKEQLVYLDPNATVGLIRNLRRVLDTQAETR